jgi:AcrR family transcriptional regulator
LARTKKAGDVRRNEFLDAALALFLERGYDATTINDVIAAVGVSKGAFYHHFAAKDDLLEGLALRFAAQAVAAIEPSLADNSLDPVARMNAFLSQSRQLKAEQAHIIWPTFKALFRPENLTLYHRINAALTAEIAPLVAALIVEGKAAGVFDTPAPETTARMILRLGTVTHDAIARVAAAEGTPDFRPALREFERELQMQGIGIDRLLGLPDGTIHFAEPGFVEALLSATGTAPDR